MIAKDITGEKHGRLTAIERCNENKRKWLFLCDCGNKKEILRYSVSSGKTKSCGCLAIEKYYCEETLSILKKCSTTHNMSDTRFYRVWTSMMARCNRPSSYAYHRYGGRGIKVCERWHKFENFMEDMHISYEDHVNSNNNTSIDRINVDGDYDPSNCKWITHKEQQNNRANNRLIEVDGIVDTVSNTSQRYGVDPEMVYNRLKRGWNWERIVTQPLRYKKKNR